MSAKTFLGLMSGTSMDGLDVVGVDIWEEGEGLAHGPVSLHSFNFPPSLRAGAFHLSQGRELGPSDILFLHHDVGQWMAECAKEAAVGWGLKKVDGVGLHGQTIWHEPHRKSAERTGRATWQLGEPAYLAKTLACPVVYDFRTHDMVVGGQGAPLAPLAQSMMLKENKLSQPLLTLNIGGISNGALFQKNQPVNAGDFGPGMVWLDACLSLYGHGETFDHHGQLCATGSVQEDFLLRLKDWDPFPSLPFPKSTGREHYQEDTLNQLLSEGRRPALADALATLAAYGAEAITKGFVGLGLEESQTARICISGGGSQHRPLVEKILGSLQAKQISPEDIFGVGFQAMEGLCFALLAFERLAGRRLACPAITGAGDPVFYGKVCEV